MIFVTSATAADPTPALLKAAQAGEKTWRRVQRRDPRLSAREMFTYALALCEAKLHPERLERIFDTAAQMQDRDKASRGYGNFRWYWSEQAVRDFNSVEFCMQGGSELWLRHRDSMPPAAGKVLRPMLDLAVEGCLRHNVPVSYTNIALMNAENLILLGEALGRPTVADEGYRRLEQFVLYTWDCGVGEYVSPTYYGVDIECLLLIHRFARRPEGRLWARALLDLIWTDVAANWYAPSSRLGGARSRDYNYLRGAGYLDRALRAFGYLPPSDRVDVADVWFSLGAHRPPAPLAEMSRTQWPRLVRQRWGHLQARFRTHYLCKDVTLSCSGANYGPMDLPLTVDLPGPASALRCYYIPDGRHDPYGKKKIPAGAHSKALHLRSFWAGTQRRSDALGIVLHEPPTASADPSGTLETHFVMPLDVDAFRIGDTRVVFDARQARTVPVSRGQSVVIHKGTAAVGLRVPWSRDLDGRPAQVALVWDANAHRAVRLTITHHTGRSAPVGGQRPGAALWVRIGSGLADQRARERWGKAFAAAEARVTCEPTRLAVNVAGTDGAVSLVVSPAYRGVASADPPYGRCILEIDGKDVGRAILKNLTPVTARSRAVRAVKPVLVSADSGTVFEAESAVVTPGMVVGADRDASGGRYVWAPGVPGGRGRVSGSAIWRLKIAKGGRYWLWGRVWAPTSSDDSFYLRLFNDRFTPVDRTDWHTGRREGWQWTPVSLIRGKAPTPLSLPAGVMTLEILPREDGTKLDRLFLTPRQDQRPDQARPAASAERPQER